MTTAKSSLPTDNTGFALPHHKPWQSCFRPGLFEGKVALVTGGGTGIGRAIATELASLGATTVIASRSHDQCVAAALEINQSVRLRNEKGSVIAGPSTNIRNEEEIKALIRFVVATCGALHLLVNNAGGQFISPAADLTRNGFAAVVDTNLTGTFLVCREAYQQYMQANGGGSIVNITLGNRNGMPSMMHSGAARAGVENMTATLCTEWIDSNVRVNCVRPGIIWTESGFENYGPDVGDMFLERILPTLPARRLGTAEEVSSAVVWLLSEGATYVTGTVLCVDGGSAYTFLPLVEIEDSMHLQPAYGTLARKARL
jgi:peroxisomal trans-2-enoyl-CoA reductase